MGLVVLLVVIIMSRIAGQESRPKYGNSVGKDHIERNTKDFPVELLVKNFSFL